MSLSNYSENLVLNWAFTTGTVTRPTSWYVSLHTDDPGETGANETTTGTDADYVRKSTTFAAATGGSLDNAGAVTWTVATGSGGYTIRHVGVWDAATSGNFLGGGELYSEHTVSASSVVSFAIGDLTIALD